MAYSKFRHEGCGVVAAAAGGAAAAAAGGEGGEAAASASAGGGEAGAGRGGATWKERWWRMQAPAMQAERGAPSAQRAAPSAQDARFGLEALLRCTWHYAIGDQELATTSP